MRAGLKALMGALDRAEAPVRFFIRDDDAGVDNARLFALVDRTLRAAVPIDLAVIPQAADPGLAAELNDRFDAAPDLVGLHQHGYAHCNHETQGRKAEFGGAREAGAQRSDLMLGWARLQALFGPRLDPIFTPPWNRCSADTPRLVATLGFAALSRDATAPAQHELPELPVHVDWCKHRHGVVADGVAGDAIAFDLARRTLGGTTLGLMLHHAAMDERDLDLLSAWLAAWSRHPNARWQPMRTLLSGEPS